MALRLRVHSEPEDQFRCCRAASLSCGWSAVGQASKQEIRLYRQSRECYWNHCIAGDRSEPPRILSRKIRMIRCSTLLGPVVILSFPRPLISAEACSLGRIFTFNTSPTLHGTISRKSLTDTGGYGDRRRSFRGTDDMNFSSN